MENKNLVSKIEHITPLIQEKIINVFVTYKLESGGFIQSKNFIYRLKTADEDIRSKIREDIDAYALKLIATLPIFKDDEKSPSIFDDMIGETKTVAA